MLLPHVRVARGARRGAAAASPTTAACSYRPGARFGPRHVREQSSLIRPWNPVLQVHPFERLRVADCGDVDVGADLDRARPSRPSSATLDPVMAAGAIPLCVGGDHSVTLAVLRALARRHGRWASCTSTRTRTRGTSTSACPTTTAAPFRRAIEEGLDRRRRARSRSASAGRSTAPRTSTSTPSTASR